MQTKCRFEQYSPAHVQLKIYSIWQVLLQYFVMEHSILAQQFSTSFKLYMQWSTTLKFHYTQCIWRKTQVCGLQIPYRENEDVKRFVCRAAVLTLIPMQEVEFLVQYTPIQTIDDCDNVPATTYFCNYVTEHWVESDRSLWNHYDTEGPRFANHLEG
ncbi:hypothetical protein KUTeg_011625 [Tegillarca granosa]|uniref:Uncharacterized protein n=1 Tax=Tegillarca granosa TaxID=220873 RepID=A0ABQ9F0V6_TEGGR|nr:hypothetical protein KUTeg_011625 [Tegillarca granosa]